MIKTSFDFIQTCKAFVKFQLCKYIHISNIVINANVSSSLTQYQNMLNVFFMNLITVDRNWNKSWLKTEKTDKCLIHWKSQFNLSICNMSGDLKLTPIVEIP